jgi:hypothetical protein
MDAVPSRSHLAEPQSSRRCTKLLKSSAISLKLTGNAEETVNRLITVWRYAGAGGGDGAAGTWARLRGELEGSPTSRKQQLRQLCCGFRRSGLKAAAAVFAISVSSSLLKPATPIAPTTSPFTRIGTPPRSAMMSAVTNAVRP